MRNPTEEDSTGTSREKQSALTDAMRLTCAPDRVVLAASAITRVMKTARAVIANVGDLWDSTRDALGAIERAAESVGVVCATEATPVVSATDEIASARAERVLKRAGFSTEKNK